MFNLVIGHQIPYTAVSILHSSKLLLNSYQWLDIKFLPDLNIGVKYLVFLLALAHVHRILKIVYLGELETAQGLGWLRAGDFELVLELFYGWELLGLFFYRGMRAAVGFRLGCGLGLGLVLVDVLLVVLAWESREPELYPISSFSFCWGFLVDIHILLQFSHLNFFHLTLCTPKLITTSCPSIKLAL